jgi:hypothetical protein
MNLVEYSGCSYTVAISLLCFRKAPANFQPRENFMLTLPSVWNLIISTLAFFISAWYINRYLNEQGIPKGMTRGILVLVLASLAAWGAGAAADWAQETLEGPQPEAQTTDDLVRLMKEAGTTQQ